MCCLLFANFLIPAKDFHKCASYTYSIKDIHIIFLCAIAMDNKVYIHDHCRQHTAHNLEHDADMPNKNVKDDENNKK